jgi:ankyrin repeat protein
MKLSNKYILENTIIFVIIMISTVTQSKEEDRELSMCKRIGSYAAASNIEATEEALREGGDLDCVLNLKTGKRPIMTAIHTGNKEYIQYLIDENVELNFEACNKSGKACRTPLIKAIARDDLQIIKMLLDAGADPNYECEDGKTALQKSTSKEITELLKLYGAW